MNNPQEFFNTNISRRSFVASASSLVMLSSWNNASASEVNALTVQQVIDIILKNIPVPPIKNTTDTIKSGSPDQVVTGIVTTMFATVAVIKKAIDIKANFIIAH